MHATLTPIGTFTSVILKGKSKLGKPGDLVYGNSGKNTFRGQSESRNPVAFAGGRGSDTYKLNPGQLSIVADLGGGKKDMLDVTGIDRARALWGKIQIQNDFILTDLSSGMVVLMRDPLGVLNSKNKIEYVKAQYRDPVTGEVDPRRSQMVSLETWLAGAVDFNATVQAPQYSSFDAYNQALATYRQLNGAGQLQPLLDSKVPVQFRPLVPFVIGVIDSLPFTSELGLASNADVLGAWQTAASNLGLLG